MFEELSNLAKDFGPVAAGIAFVLYRDYKREEKKDILIAAKDASLEENTKDTHKLSLKFNEASIRYENVCKSVVDSIAEQNKLLKRVAEVLNSSKSNDSLRKPHIKDDDSDPIIQFNPTPIITDQSKIETTLIRKGK